jgi:FixJ family two-component response regulator
MPVIDGIDFRNNQVADLMTGDDEIEAVCAATNSTDVLVKPFDISSLLETVKRNFKLQVERYFDPSK